MDNSTSATSTPSYERSSTAPRLKTRDENSIRWVELLDKFKSTQEKARRSQRASQRELNQEGSGTMQDPSLTAALSAAATADQGRGREKNLPDVPRAGVGGSGLGVGGSGGRGAAVDPALSRGNSVLSGGNKNRSSLANLGRLGIGGKKPKR